MRFRRWVVFTFLVHALVVLADKGAGLVLYSLTSERPEVHGAASLLASLPFILMALANMGLATAMVYHVRRGHYTAQVAIETTLLSALVWGGFIGAAAFGFTWGVLPLINPAWEVSGWLLAPVCAAVPLLLVMSYANSLQLACDKIRGYNLVHLVSSLVFLPLFLLVWWLTDEDVSLGVTWGRLAATLVVAALAVVMIRSFVRVRPRFHRDFLRDSIRYGWRANLTSVLTYLNHRIDLLIVGMLFAPLAADVATELAELLAEGHDFEGKDPETVARNRLVLKQVAPYSLAVTFAELVWHFPEAMRDLFFSKVASSTEDRAKVITPTLVRISVLVSAAAATAILFMVDPTMRFITWLIGKGDAWDVGWSGPVNEALLWLIPGTVGFTVAKVIQADMMARNLQGPCVRGCAVVFVVMLGLDFLWVPSGGATGAAQASTVAYLASSAYMLWAYRRDTGVSLSECLLLRRSDVTYIWEIVLAVWNKLRRRR